ncbi:10777_t:CDS:1 [Paraglomus occultum]|uniref:10777_t:CDS:1 n=1 Tax=Paraglomus occultum TaxID=144539 RepID=A0A9N8ZDR3_9GLOM|nr:10777_t:CDS:1 [Paraglomus occultum]
MFESRSTLTLTPETVTASSPQTTAPPTPQSDTLSIIERLSPKDQALLANPPYPLTLCLEELVAPGTKPRKSRRKDDSTPPRPQNGFIIFRKDCDAKLQLIYPDGTFNSQIICKKVGEEWRRQPPVVKKFFQILQKIAFEKHKELYPDYKYTPKKRKSFKCEKKFDVYGDLKGYRSKYTPVFAAPYRLLNLQQMTVDPSIITGVPPATTNVIQHPIVTNHPVQYEMPCLDDYDFSKERDEHDGGFLPLTVGEIPEYRM